MKDWIYIISVIASLLLGLKMKSNCCGKMCYFSIEKQENNNETLRSIKITKRSRVKPSKQNEKETETDTSSDDSWAEELKKLPEIK